MYNFRVRFLERVLKSHFYYFLKKFLFTATLVSIRQMQPLGTFYKYTYISFATNAMVQREYSRSGDASWRLIPSSTNIQTEKMQTW